MLAGLAPHLPAEEREPVLARAVEAATAVDTPYHRARALRELALHLARRPCDRDCQTMSEPPRNIGGTPSAQRW